MLILFVSIREGVQVGVVNEAMVTISPQELLGPDSKEVVSHELRPVWSAIIHTADRAHRVNAGCIFGEKQ